MFKFNERNLIRKSKRESANIRKKSKVCNFACMNLNYEYWRVINAQIFCSTCAASAFVLFVQSRGGKNMEFTEKVTQNVCKYSLNKVIKAILPV